MNTAVHSAEPLFLVGIHRGSFRAGTPGLVLVGIEIIIPSPDHSPRPAFKVRFEDGVEDYFPMYANWQKNILDPHFALVSEEDVKAGKLPEVTE